MLGLFGIKKPNKDALKTKLPQINAFVELTIIGGGPKGSVTVESVGARTMTVSALPGMRVGMTGVFVYGNPAGRFRFSSKIAAVSPTGAVFALPSKIETIQAFAGGGAQKRASVRLDATVPCMWRLAHAGRGTGEFSRASLTDISRTGASLIVDRELKKGAHVEVKFAVNSAAAPLMLLGEVMRASKIEASKKNSLGLRFEGLKAEEDRAIMEFINKRQAERRSRGLA